MSTLRVGRVTLARAEAVVGEVVANTRRLQLQGHAHKSTLAETVALRDELQALAAYGGIIPVTHDADPDLDGFYAPQRGVFNVVTLTNGGVINLELMAERLGNDAAIIFRSKLVGTVAENDHGVSTAESEPFHAPPRGHYGYNPGASIPGSITRPGSDGGILVYRDVDFGVDPWWSIDVADFYSGAARIATGGVLRAGLHTPNVPGNWELGNGLVRITPNATGGRIDVAHHDGSDWTAAKVWRIQSGGADVGAWDAISILRNRAEECVIRLTRDVPEGGEIILDLALRRGSRFLTGYLTRHGAATLKVVLAAAEAGQTVTPTGASSPVGLEAAADDADGNRYVVGSARSFTADTTNGGLSKASTTTLDFFLGSAVGGSGAQSGDTSADLCLQYLGVVTEHVVGAPR